MAERRSAWGVSVSHSHLSRWCECGGGGGGCLGQGSSDHHWHRSDNEQSYLPGWHSLVGTIVLADCRQCTGTGDKEIFWIRSKTRLKEKNFTRVFTQIYDWFQFTYWSIDRRPKHDFEGSCQHAPRLEEVVGWMTFLLFWCWENEFEIIGGT